MLNKMVKMKDITLLKERRGHYLCPVPYDEKNQTFIIPDGLLVMEHFNADDVNKLITKAHRNIRSIISTDTDVSYMDYLTMFLSNSLTNFVIKLNKMGSVKKDTHYPFLVIYNKGCLKSPDTGKNIFKVRFSIYFKDDDINKGNLKVEYFDTDGVQSKLLHKTINNHFKKGKNYRKLFSIILKETEILCD